MRTVFKPVALILPTRSQELMVPDIRTNPNKQIARWLFCSDLSINKKIIVKMALTGTKRNDEKMSKLWCTEYQRKCLIRTTQMILGVKEKPKCSSCGAHST